MHDKYRRIKADPTSFASNADLTQTLLSTTRLVKSISDRLLLRKAAYEAKFADISSDGEEHQSDVLIHSWRFYKRISFPQNLEQLENYVEGYESL